jgi:WD40 repeat protein
MFSLYLWNIETETKIWEISSSNNENEYQNWAIFSPDGHTIVTVDQFTYPYVSDDEDNDEFEVEEEEEDRTDPVHVSVVFTATGKSKFCLPHTRGAVVRDAAFSDGGDKLVTVEENILDGGTCRMWNMSDGDLLWEAKQDRAILSVAWGRDWLKDQTRIAFAMGNIPRLGHGSWVLPLDQGVVKMILHHL